MSESFFFLLTKFQLTLTICFLFSLLPAFPSSPHLPSFNQPSKQVSFHVCFFACRAVRKVGMMDPGEREREREAGTFLKKKKLHRRDSSTFSHGGRALEIVAIFPCYLRCLFCFCQCRASSDIDVRASVRFGGRKKAWTPEIQRAGFPCRRTKKKAGGLRKASCSFPSSETVEFTTAMADAPVIAPKSAFEDRWNGIVRPYSQVSGYERDSGRKRERREKSANDDGRRQSYPRQRERGRERATSSSCDRRPRSPLPLSSTPTHIFSLLILPPNFF